MHGHDFHSVQLLHIDGVMTVEVHKKFKYCVYFR
jgi:hypothetical protein